MLTEIVRENRRASFTTRWAARNLYRALAPPEESRRRRRWRQSFELIGRLFESSRIVRLVGPNDRPLERHEFERPEYLNRNIY